MIQAESADRSHSPAVTPSRRAHHRSGRPVAQRYPPATFRLLSYRPLSGSYPYSILFVLCFRPFPPVNSTFLHSSLLFKFIVPLFVICLFNNKLFSGKTHLAPLAIISKHHNNRVHCTGKSLGAYALPDAPYRNT